MQITEDEKRDLKTKMLVDGCLEYETDFFDTNAYKNLRTTMLDYLPTCNKKIFDFKLLPKSEILKAGRYVIDKHFGKIDLRVPFANGDELESKIVAIFGCNPKKEKYDNIINYINNQVELVRVTDIPVYLNTAAEKNGYVFTTYFYENKIMGEDYYKKLPACVREIAIEGNCDDDAKSIYVHEMTHALVNRHKGNVRNLLNNEALSIFMEKVAAQDIDQSGFLLDIKNLNRILHNKHCLLDRELFIFRDELFKDILKDETYLLSTIQATALFNTYSKGSNKTRNEIDKAVGNIFTGEEVLEDVLDHYEASLEKGSKIMQRQIKKYHSKYMGK